MRAIHNAHWESGDMLNERSEAFGGLRSRDARRNAPRFTLRSRREAPQRMHEASLSSCVRDANPVFYMLPLGKLSNYRD